MSFLAGVMSDGFAALIKGVGDVVDKFVQTADEKAAIQVELTRLIAAHQLAVLQSADQYEKELSSRLQFDMQYGTWLSKNIRPLALIFLLAVYTLMAITDGVIHAGSFDFLIKAEYAAGFRSFTELGLMFYFGGRSIEKVTNMASAAYLSVKGK